VAMKQREKVKDVAVVREWAQETPSGEGGYLINILKNIVLFVESKSHVVQVGNVQSVQAGDGTFLGQKILCMEKFSPKHTDKT